MFITQWMFMDGIISMFITQFFFFARVWINFFDSLEVFNFQYFVGNESSSSLSKVLYYMS